ncbi:hypothetical protein TrST_g4054 [Triparma strigata]|uniref:Protein-serine/threonine phosphatase n=1 Tax=Triparma strigata TaxID=1606541 RepID=A0A9W7BWI9_9STRA|nr:hypothetical protein TrST_g4054 [Triparma strigata]
MPGLPLRSIVRSTSSPSPDPLSTPPSPMASRPLGSNRRSAPSHYQRSLSLSTSVPLPSSPSPYLSPYATLHFTTSEDEDDRHTLQGTIHRYKTFWSDGRFTITSEEGRKEGTVIYRPLDEFMGRGKNVQRTEEGWEVEEGVGVKVGTGRITKNSDGTRTLTPTSLNTVPTHTWSLHPNTTFTAGNTLFTVLPTSPLTLSQKSSLPPSSPPTILTLPPSPTHLICGRSADSDLTISDRELSRFHFSISTSTTPPTLTDLHSTNGTYIITKSLPSRLITPSSEFVVGRTGFKVGRYEWGGVERQGARRTMEDQMCYEDWCVDREVEGVERMVLASVTIGAVFDGHGGGECSKYLESTFVNRLKKGISTSPLISSIWSAVQRQDTSKTFSEDVFYGKVDGDESSKPIRDILKTAFLDLDETFISDPEGPSAGSTCSAAIMFGNRLFAANVGDSRVVLCREGGNVIEMTNDHKPTRPDEAKRVREAGGFILHKRVMGELAISRAFGDKGFKSGVRGMLGGDSDSSEDGKEGGSPMDAEMSSAPLVIAEPEVTEILTDPRSDEFILIACDGLFDVFSSSDAVGFARNLLLQQKGDPAAVSSMLASEAINVRRSRDNVSVIIIVLRPFWEEYN